MVRRRVRKLGVSEARRRSSRHVCKGSRPVICLSVFSVCDWVEGRLTEVAAASTGHDGIHCQNAADTSPWRTTARISRDLP